LVAFWKVVRPYYWMLDRRVRSMNRLVVIGAVVALSLAGQWLYHALHGRRALPTGDQADTFVASVVVFGGLLTLLTALINVNNILYQLYLAPDLDLLMVSPVPRPIVFAVKLLQCSPSALLPVVPIGIVLTWFGIDQGVRWLYYILIAMLLASVVIFVTSTVMGLVILTTRLIPTTRIRTWIPVIFVLLPILLVIWQQRISAWFADQSAFHAAIASALVHERDLAALTGGGLVVGLAGSLGVYQLFNTSFEQGWNRYREVPAAPTHSRRAPTWARVLPTHLRPVMTKEWLETRRDPRRLLNLLQPAILVALFLVPLGGQDAVDILKPILFWFMLIFVPLFISVAVLGIPLMTILQEGPSLALLRIAPISMGDILQGKLFAAWGMMGIPWTVVTVVSGILLQFAWWQVALLMVAEVVALLAMVTVAIGFGALRADFAARDLEKRLSTVTGYVVVAINVPYALWVIATMTWIVVHLDPGSEVFKVIEVFKDQPLAHTLLSDAVWVPVLLVGGHVFVCCGLLRLWVSAIRRLAQMEL
jgi:hypothetical protein